MKTYAMMAALAAAGLLAACGQGEQAASTDAAAPIATAEGGAPGGPDAIIQARQANLKKLGAANRAMSEELEKSEPSLAVFQEHVQTVSALAPELHGWFPAGTGQEVGVKTAAKPEIWQQPDVFKARHAALVAQANAFAATVQSGDMTLIRAGVPELGAACRNCHQTFRQRD